LDFCPLNTNSSAVSGVFRSKSASAAVLRRRYCSPATFGELASINSLLGFVRPEAMPPSNIFTHAGNNSSRPNYACRVSQVKTCSADKSPSRGGDPKDGRTAFRLQGVN